MKSPWILKRRKQQCPEVTKTNTRTNRNDKPSISKSDKTSRTDLLVLVSCGFVDRLVFSELETLFQVLELHAFKLFSYVFNLYGRPYEGWIRSNA